MRTVYLDAPETAPKWHSTTRVLSVREAVEVAVRLSHEHAQRVQEAAELQPEPPAPDPDPQPHEPLVRR